MKIYVVTSSRWKATGNPGEINIHTTSTCNIYPDREDAIEDHNASIQDEFLEHAVEYLDVIEVSDGMVIQAMTHIHLRVAELMKGRDE